MNPFSLDQGLENKLIDISTGRATSKNIREYIITGKEQKPPKNLSEALKSSSFKKELSRFLMKE